LPSWTANSPPGRTFGFLDGALLHRTVRWEAAPSLPPHFRHTVSSLHRIHLEGVSVVRVA
jgi:hypothetical protein